jgi:hypothetical protein
VTPPRRVGLTQMLRAGVRAVSDYTGTFFGLFLVQLLVAAGTGFVIWQIFASQFAHRPLFDEGVDGDLVSLIEALRHSGTILMSVRWVAIGAVVLWLFLSWFLTGGLIAVLAERPHGRRETARTFGAGGAATFFVFARLGILSLVGHALVFVVAVIGLDLVIDDVERALTLGHALGALFLGLLPAIIVMSLLWTIIDHARVELVLRRPTHERLGAIATFLRASAFVLRRPIAFAHVLVWIAAFLLVSVLYAWAGFGHAMLGASGAIALAIVRQGVVLVRMGLKVALVGGQVELGATRPPPPRPVAPPADAG